MFSTKINYNYNYSDKGGGGGGNGSNIYSQSILVIEENPSFDFGEISMASGVVSFKAKLKNNGNESLIINKVYTSCMCTTAVINIKGQKSGPFGMPGHLSAGKANAIIGPGEKVIVKTIFDPAAHGPSGVGPIERQISVDAGAKEPIILGFKAVVTP